MQLDYVEDVQKVVQKFEEMDADEYENSNPELKNIYITHALEARRRRYLEKKRKLEEKSGYLLYVVVFVILSLAYRIISYIREPYIGIGGVSLKIQCI